MFQVPRERLRGFVVYARGFADRRRLGVWIEDVEIAGFGNGGRGGLAFGEHKACGAGGEEAGALGWEIACVIVGGVERCGRGRSGGWSVEAGLVEDSSCYNRGSLTLLYGP